MNLRQLSEENEIKSLSEFAQKSSLSIGRKAEEEDCIIRTKYQRDRDRILHSKAFRRLMHKTQVFFAPDGDHYRTRLTHTLEVSQISRTVARSLRLNEDLTEAIALGHDLGHTPFGHSGEDALTNIRKKYSVIKEPIFEHNKQSIRVTENIEKLNLTHETLDGILNHRGAGNPLTLEGSIVQICDKIAYVNHDIEDSIRANILIEKDLPIDIINTLGKTSSQRISYLVQNIVLNSMDKDYVSLSDDAKEQLYLLRKFLFKNVYNHDRLKKEDEKVNHLLGELYKYFYETKNTLPDEYAKSLEENDRDIVVCDYIAGMTDRYAISKYNEIFLPKNWKI